ncbi:MAG: hypothetical protein ACRDN0_31760, partial [Trebonia sp.]
MFSYNHNADNGYGFEVSRIANDCIEFGGRTYLAYTSVNNWNSGDGSLMAGVAYLCKTLDGGDVGRGTTNVDVSPPLRRALGEGRPGAH